VRRIACISCPTLYRRLLDLKSPSCTAVCLEYDNRFQIFGDDFIAYDYNRPLALPPGLEGTFDIVIADPPFLSEECLRKTASTVCYLAKKNVVLCTGSYTGHLVAVVSKDVRNCNRMKIRLQCHWFVKMRAENQTMPI